MIPFLRRLKCPSKKASINFSRLICLLFRSNADTVKARLAQWQAEAIKKRAESMDIEAKYCNGSECDLYVAKFCKQENLNARERADLNKFLAFSKRRGYLPFDATLDDMRDFCQQWRNQSKR